MMTEILKCRNCINWYTTPQMQQWKGNCHEHPFEKDKYSEDASPNYECGGKDYKDKYAKYRMEVK